MKIYFSCSLTGGRNDQSVYSALVEWMLTQGHDVPTAHLARPDILAREAAIPPEAVFTRDITWVDAAQVLVAEVTTPSHGVGYEIAHAVSQSKPVLCLARNGVSVSKMLAGNPRVRFERYASAEEAVSKVRIFLEAAGTAPSG